MHQKNNGEESYFEDGASEQLKHSCIFRTETEREKSLSEQSCFLLHFRVAEDVIPSSCMNRPLSTRDYSEGDGCSLSYWEWWRQQWSWHWSQRRRESFAWWRPDGEGGWSGTISRVSIAARQTLSSRTPANHLNPFIPPMVASVWQLRCMWTCNTQHVLISKQMNKLVANDSQNDTYDQWQASTMKADLRPHETVAVCLDSGDKSFGTDHGSG